MHSLVFDDYDLDCLIGCLRLSQSVTGDRLIAEIERQCPDRVPYSSHYPRGLGVPDEADAPSPGAAEGERG